MVFVLVLVKQTKTISLGGKRMDRRWKKIDRIGRNPFTPNVREKYERLFPAGRAVIVEDSICKPSVWSWEFDHKNGDYEIVFPFATAHEAKHNVTRYFNSHSV